MDKSLCKTGKRHKGKKNHYIFQQHTSLTTGSSGDKINLFSHCIAATTFFGITDLETHFYHLRQCNLLAEIVQLVSNTWPVGTPGGNPRARSKLRGWAPLCLQLGWGPSWRDNIAAGISRGAPGKLNTQNCPPESHSEAHPALSSESTNLIVVLGGKGRTCNTETSLKLSVTRGFAPHEIEQ